MHRFKSIVINAFKVSVCIVALVVVARGVNWTDQVITTRDGAVFSGRIIEHIDRVVVERAGYPTAVIPRTEVATDANGTARIEYGLRTALATARKPLLLISLCVFLLVPFLQGYRLRLLLRADGAPIGWWPCTRISFAGNFLNFAAPLGSTAGDVAKAYFVSRHSDRKTEAMTLVFVDRAIGLFTLLAAVTLIAVLSPATSRLSVMRWYAMALFGASCLGVVVYLTPVLRRVLNATGILARLPMVDQLRRVDATMRRLASRGGVLAKAVLTTAILHMVAAVAFFVIAGALGMRTSAGNLVEYYAGFSTGELVKALPGPPQGIGTAEMAYRFLFAPFGSASQIVCAAFAMRFVMLVCALPGVIFAVTERSRTSASPTHAETAQTAFGEERTAAAA